MSNYYSYYRSKVLCNKALGLLHLLLILDRPWQYISIDFKEMPLDQDGMSIVCVFVDRLGKRLISVPCNKTVDAQVMA